MLGKFWAVLAAKASSTERAANRAGRYRKDRNISSKASRRTRRVSHVEQLERREVFAVETAEVWGPGPILGTRLGLPVADKGTMLVPSGESPVHFWIDSRNTVNNDELGYFLVDGPDGRITVRQGGDPDAAPALDGQGRPQYLWPGDPLYADYALGEMNAFTVFDGEEVPNGSSGNKIVDLPGDRYLGFYVIQDASLQYYRTSAAAVRPHVWFSVDKANADGYEHFHSTGPTSPAYRRDVLQFQVEDSPVTRGVGAWRRPTADFNDLIFSVHILPFTYEDDYSVFNAGADFTGAPQPIKADTPDDGKNRGLGLLFNDRAFSGKQLTVTDIRLDSDDAPWVQVGNPRTRTGKATLQDASLHGRVTVYPNGGIAFEPTASDPYWQLPAGSTEPDPIYIQYRVSDGIDSVVNYVGVGHGFYRRGGAPDAVHSGQRMYLLGGNAAIEEFGDATRRFFTEGSNGKDIVLISQAPENSSTADYVYDATGGTARSVTLLNLLTREAANDPRVAKIIDGADAIWLGGGGQSTYFATWQGTLAGAALTRASLGAVAIGGGSAGLAVLGAMAYVDLPWDGIKSRFATLEPLSPRVNMVGQGGGGLPFVGLSNTINSPLFNIVTDTHFVERDRMGRLIALTGRAAGRPTSGLGVDSDTAILVEPQANDWTWTVFGRGDAYFISPNASVATETYDARGRLNYSLVNVVRLDNGSSQRLSAIRRATPTYQISVSHGTVFSKGNGGDLY